MVVESLQAFFANPLVQGAIALVLVVIGAKMNAPIANVLLVIAWSLFVIAFFRLEPVAKQPLLPRILWTLMLASVAGLVLYALSWESSSPRSSQSAGTASGVDSASTTAELQVANDEVKRDDDKHKVHIRLFLKNYGNRVTIATVNLRAFYSGLEAPPPQRDNPYPIRVEFPPGLERPIEHIFWDTPDNYAAVWDGRRRVELELTAQYESYPGRPVELVFRARLEPMTERMAIVGSMTRELSDSSH